MIRRVVFMSGTRADFGKLKPLIQILNQSSQFEVYIFATGMHMDVIYGYTVHEIEKCGFPNIYKYINHDCGTSMDIILARTIEGFGNYIRTLQPDLIVVHGDRIEALAGATVGALNNVLVAHIEGGELSGTVDELIRHAVSKLSHIHFVANSEAKQRLIQMGELEESVHVIGSPDMDIMLSQNLPHIEDVKKYYGINFNQYALSLYHPVTTEYERTNAHAAAYFNALKNSHCNYVVIYPNNDRGSEVIMHYIKELESNERFKIFPSIRFEYFLTMLKNALLICGNSSAGIREAPYYGVATVNVGTRQRNRSRNNNIIHTSYGQDDIEKAIAFAKALSFQPLSDSFGDGKSALHFLRIVTGDSLWSVAKQKQFVDATV